MTRILSELLGAEQLRFGTTIRQLEAASGSPSIDIRLMSEISQRSKRKLQVLGLDPHDTTGAELYHALLERFQHDEKLAQKTLGLGESASTEEILEAAIAFVKKSIGKRTAFALKNSVAKQLLKKTPPKRTMKQLGYRSLDSMLKHEAIPHLYVAAFLSESSAWRKKFLEQYTKLQPGNFELRSVDVSMPRATRWSVIAEQLGNNQPPVVVFKELGAVVVLKNEQPATVITSISLILSALNDIQSTTSFLKLQQMKPDFGTFVHTIAEQEPLTKAELMGKIVPWRAVHQYYARFKDAYNALIFEPHIQPDDLKWFHPESILEKIHPAIDFWHDTRYTAHMYGSEKVSLNLFDVARNYISTSPYDKRTLQSLRQSLWQELMIRYLDQKNVEQAIAGDLATEPVFAELEDI